MWVAGAMGKLIRVYGFSDDALLIEVRREDTFVDLAPAFSR